ncbi:hypothetical protein MKY59_07770 [Paenibacillus sp. FSL W8-0426]|uniref:hypothetical protein n=1 Tax=Paenibacillus sp. FSL W8-0426 TaxID=2921714 RepID=UPI0030DD79B8
MKKVQISNTENYMYITVSRPDTKGEFEGMFRALKNMADEGLNFDIYTDEDHKQIILAGPGELYLREMAEQLKDRFGMKLSAGEPQVLYKTTIRQAATAEGRFIRQSSGRDSYGHCWIAIEPLPRDEGYMFINEVEDENIIPAIYIPAIDEGIQSIMHRGILGRFPIVDIRVRLLNGSYNSTDASMMAYKIAGFLGFREAYNQASPVVLEPWMKVRFPVEEKHILQVNDVLERINARNIEYVEMTGGGAVVADVALRLLMPGQLYQIVSGMEASTRSYFNNKIRNNRDFMVQFSYYDEVPPELENDIIDRSDLKDAYHYSHEYHFSEHWDTEETERHLKQLIESFWGEG